MVEQPLKTGLAAALLFWATLGGAWDTLPVSERSPPRLQAGTVNPGVVLTGEQLRQRERLYREGHLIVGPDFRPRRVPPAGPVVQAQIDPAAPPGPPARLNPAVTAAPTDGRGLLWKIDDGHAQPSYLFGTIHLEDPRVLKLPAAVTRALDGARSFTMEALLDDAAQFTGDMFSTDGKLLADLAGEKLAQRTIELLDTRNVPARVARIIKPWAATILLSTPKAATGQFLDRRLFQRARQNNQPVFGLESLDEQFGALNDLTMEDQISMLKYAVNNYDQLPEAVETLIDLYLKRDLDGLAAASRRLAPPGGAEEQFRQRLVDERNPRMAERMIPRLVEGGAFVAVGALHLPGENGLVSLLRRRGYRVTAVY